MFETTDADITEEHILYHVTISFERWAIFFRKSITMDLDFMQSRIYTRYIRTRMKLVQHLVRTLNTKLMEIRQVVLEMQTDQTT